MIQDEQQQIILAWSNFAVLIMSSIIFTVYYVKSVQPAALEKIIGIEAYEKCKWYRIVSGTLMTVAAVNYVLFYFYPLPITPSPLRVFPWPYYVSIAIATVITIPCGYLMWIGIRDAGEETMTPKKEHTMYSENSIYGHMRHPQAIGEFPLFWTFAFIAHSPFLALFSFLYVPIWYYFSIEEEKDLILRYGAAYEEYRQRVGWFPKLSFHSPESNRNKVD